MNVDEYREYQAERARLLDSIRKQREREGREILVLSIIAFLVVAFAIIRHATAAEPEHIAAVMIDALATEGVNIEDSERYSRDEIEALAEGIAEAGDEDAVLDALATAWRESRFRVDAIGGGRAGLEQWNGRSECGPFQQTPRYIWPPEYRDDVETACARLMEPDLAAWHYYAQRERYRARYGERWPCHYNAGGECTPDGRFYLDNWRRARRWLRGIYEGRASG